MSFDYFAFRLTRPVESLKDLDETAASKEDWFDEGCATLASNFPDLRWKHHEKDFCGCGDGLGIGRFEVKLKNSDNVTFLVIRGHGGEVQNAYVAKLAAAVGAIAFEAPTGRRLNH